MIPQLFIVDAVNILFRAYYAIAPMTNSKGESTNALFGFIRSIQKLIDEFSPEYFICVFDGPDNKRSRTTIYKEYKSHREGMPKDLALQLEHAHTFCSLAGIPMLSVPGVEADDTIGSIASWIASTNTPVTICSADKDLCQLVNDNIHILNPHKDLLRIDRAQVKQLFGVFPEQIVDYLAIVGDASDNIPGLTGFGAKTAVSLLNEYQTLENILASTSTFQGKKREVLENEKEIALLSKQLATIQTNVDFPHDPEFFRLQPPAIEPLKQFYQEMHFLSLLKQLSSQQIPVEESRQYTLINDEETLTQLIHTLKKTTEGICVDTETTSTHPLRANLVGIGFGIKPGQAWYIPMNGNLQKERVIAQLKPLFDSPSTQWIGHNIKYDLHILSQEGLEMSSIAFDTMLASYLISPHVQRHNLDELTLEKFNVVKIPISALIGKGKQETTMDQVPIDQVSGYCCEDVDYTLRLKALFSTELDQLELRSLFENIELPLIAVLARMERRGIFCDVNVLHAMSLELTKQIQECATAIYTLAQEEFNINSPKQLSAILFEKMGIPPPKKTTTGFSTAIDVLESLRDTAPIVNEIITYRSLEKLRSTYVDALPEDILPETKRIHCTFNQSVTATGRLSCQNPNLQNIPTRTKEGKKIRAAFRPAHAGYSFLSADYSQIELRLLAHLSQDPHLLKAFQEEEDIHAYTASLIFNIPLNEVSEEMRHRAKAVNFGILYGQQAFGLSKLLKIDYAQAETFIKTYFERYSYVKDFLESCKESARKTGHAITLTGRQRPIPEINSKNPQLKSAAERLAINTPLQGTAADLIKIAMVQIDQQIYPNCHMLLQIHDELLFEAPDTELPGLSALVKTIMEGVFPLSVPLTVNICVGKNWGEC